MLSFYVTFIHFIHFMLLFTLAYGSHLGYLGKNAVIASKWSQIRNPHGEISAKSVFTLDCRWWGSKVTFSDGAGGHLGYFGQNYILASNWCQNRFPHVRFSAKSVFTLDCRCSGSKVNFSRWRRRAFWIWPPSKKCRQIFEGPCF